MTALKLPLGVTFDEQVSHNAVPPCPGQGDQLPDPPLHVDVVCARAGSLTTPTNARAMTTIRNSKPTDFVMGLEQRISIQPPSFIALAETYRPVHRTCRPKLRIATASRT